jgi:hypothetical protein
MFGQNLATFLVPDSSRQTKAIVKVCRLDKEPEREVPVFVYRRKRMSVSAISSGASPTAVPLTQRTQEDVAGRQLIQALNNGNLDAAQQAYNTLASFGTQ